MGQEAAVEWVGEDVFDSGVIQLDAIGMESFLDLTHVQATLCFPFESLADPLGFFLVDDQLLLAVGGHPIITPRGLATPLALPELGNGASGRFLPADVIVVLGKDELDVPVEATAGGGRIGGLHD